MIERRCAAFVALPLALLIAAVLAAILWLCDGHFIYSLDDPYISLNLGWHIAHGQYGINASEAASPSSSVLYPLILAGFAWASWQDWVPLVINAAAALGTGAAFAAAACRWGIVGRPERVARGAVLIVILCLALNTIGLVFTGLEHSLHALTSVLLVFGLARALEEDRVPWFLVAAIVLVPLWRFEGIALALLAVAGLAAVRQIKTASLALVGVVATLAAYMAAMHALGLPLLPSSVLTKSAVTQQFVEGSRGSLGFIAFTLRSALDRLSAEALPVCGLLLLVVAHPLLRLAQRRPNGDSGWSLYREVVFASVIAGALLAHILFGAWGWFARYEAYAVAFGAAGAMILWRRAIAALVDRGSRLAVALALCGLVYAGICYIWTTIETPLAARETYELQYQMHRFAADFYRRPVGVNDIGWVSYRNPNYVLDLWGLGSEAAREARARGLMGSAWIDALVKSRQVGLVMIYDKWFPGQIPPAWRRLAVLQTRDHLIFAFNRVSFYATSPEAVPAGHAALEAFVRRLGPGTLLTMSDESAAAGDRPTGAD